MKTFQAEISGISNRCGTPEGTKKRKVSAAAGVGRQTERIQYEPGGELLAGFYKKCCDFQKLVTENVVTRLGGESSRFSLTTKENLSHFLTIFVQFWVNNHLQQLVSCQDKRLAGSWLDCPLVFKLQILTFSSLFWEWRVYFYISSWWLWVLIKCSNLSTVFGWVQSCSSCLSWSGCVIRTPSSSSFPSSKCHSRSN